MSSPQGDRFNRIPTRSAYPVYPEIVSPSPARRGAFEGYPSTPTLSQSSPSHQYSSDDQYSAQQPGPSSPRRRPHDPVSQSAVSRHHANSPDAAPLRLAPLPSVSRLAEGHRPAVSQPAVFQPDVPPMSPVAARSPTSDQRPVLPINQPAAVPYPPYPPSSPAPAQEEDLLRHHRMQAGDLSRGHASYLDLHHHRPPQGPNGELPRIRSGAASRGGGERLDGLRVKVPFATQCSACNEYIERNAELYGRSMMLFNDEAYLRDCRVLRCFLHCPRCYGKMYLTIDATTGEYRFGVDEKRDEEAARRRGEWASELAATTLSWLEGDGLVPLRQSPPRTTAEDLLDRMVMDHAVLPPAPGAPLPAAALGHR